MATAVACQKGEKLTAKKSLGWEKHQEAADLYGMVERHCDAKIAEGIRQVHELVDAHYEAGNPGMHLKTILPLVRAHIDEPVSEWLVKLEKEPVLYSKLLEEKKEYCGAFFERMAESIAEPDPLGYSVRHPELDHTADSLIYFGSYCLCHKSNNTQVLQVEPDEKNENAILVNQVRGKASAGTSRRREQLGISAKIDFTSMADEVPYCQLCTDLSMHTRELMRLLYNPSSDGQISEEDRKTLSTTALRISIPKFSPHYCARHNPDDEPATAYNKAHARRKIYYSMRRFTIRARHARGLSVPYWHIVRAAAYLIPDECPDQSLIEQVPVLVEEWYEAWDGADVPNPVEAKISTLIERIVDSFAAADHPLAEFVSALAFGKTGRIYDLAKSHGVFPDQIERLIDSGFLPCFQMRTLKLGGMILGDPDQE